MADSSTSSQLYSTNITADYVIRNLEPWRLQEKLDKLSHMIKIEMVKQFKKLEKSSIYHKVFDYIKEDYKESIEEILKSKHSNKNKIELIIIICSIFDKKSYNLSLIPKELFDIFWQFAEDRKYGVRLNEDGQKFRIIHF